MLTVVAAVIVRDGRVLIARRGRSSGMSGQWEFPGGKVEPGESPAAALRRELQEELGIEAEVGALLAVNEHAYDWGRGRFLFLRVDAFGGDVALHEHDRAEWVEPANLSAYDFVPADVPVAARLPALLAGPSPAPSAA